MSCLQNDERQKRSHKPSASMKDGCSPAAHAVLVESEWNSRRVTCTVR